MRTPRRVPWTSQSELSELYEWLFAPSADIASRRRGLARMSVYISSPSCPAFIHLLHTLVSADLLPPPADSAAAHATRLTSAMAVVRFINGMVDPLQTGPYARPISHLAASIQIPASLISLRHRATHEDLPPLPLLRQSVLQAIHYLHTFSFLPLLASSSTQPAYEGRDRAEKLVGRWKRLMKDRLRDREVAEDTARAKELRRVRRGLESEEVEDVVEALCGTEGMIPLARKKRPGKTDTAPPTALLQVWAPLLVHLTAVRPTYPALLAEHIVSALIDDEGRRTPEHPSQEGRREGEKERQSFRWTLAVWLIWLWEGLSGPGRIGIAEECRRPLWNRVVSALLAGDMILAGSLAQIDGSLQDSWRSIAPMLLEPDEPDLLSGLDDVNMEGMDEADRMLAQMEARLGQLQRVAQPILMDGARSTPGSTLQNGHDAATAPGWRKLGPREWRACPMGVWGVA